MSEYFNKYQNMWVMVFYDLPMQTTPEKRRYLLFRKKLLKDGFRLFQFSIYMRHCATRANAEVHIKRVQAALPADGHVGILTITDRQFGNMEIYYGRQTVDGFQEPQQLELF
jgi:CRISPR-associated protein Cas2